jgi:NAD-dependent oxidoreductase involved in siderophore biosynthesis
MPTSASVRTSFIHAVIPVWLVTAAWDFLCATVLSVFAYHTTVARLWQGVASTVLGPAALDGGAKTVIVGIALHLAVAFTWSALFVAIARVSPTILRMISTPSGALAVAVAYGPIIWLVMSLVIIPLATGRPPRFGFRWWVQIGAHVPFVTIPLVFTARRVLLRTGPLPALARGAESVA